MVASFSTENRLMQILLSFMPTPAQSFGLGLS